MHRRSALLLAATMMLAAAAAAEPSRAGEIWTDNAADALARAAREKKDLLVAFTGSDWTASDPKLAAEVFGQAQFAAEAPGAFVLLRLDFPQKKPLDAALRRQNDEWKARFEVGGFPTVLLLDSAGKVYAQTGYRQGGAAAYLKHLAELRALREKRDADLARAAAAAGVERARLLDSAISSLGRQIAVDHYSGVVAEICMLDGDGKAGLKPRYDAWAALRKADRSAAANRTNEAVASLDEAVKLLGPTGEATQEALYFKGFLCQCQNDKPGARAAFEAAIKALPNSRRARECRMIIDRQLK